MPQIRSNRPGRFLVNGFPRSLTNTIGPSPFPATSP